MIALLCILSVFVLLIVGFLIIPIRFIINTNTNTYTISQPVFFKVRILPDSDYLIKLRFRILFIWFNFYPFLSKPKSQEKKKKTKSIKNRNQVSPGLIWDIIKGFRIKKLNADIDTGDYPLNAQLFPVAQQITGKNTFVNINFENNNSLNLLITYQLYKIAQATIKNRYFNN